MRLLYVAGVPRSTSAHLPVGPVEVSLRELNDDLLATHGGDWRHPPALPDGWEQDPALEPLRVRAREVLAGAGDLLIWDDPRAAPLLAFWRTVADVTVLLAVCEPDAAVRDLVAGHGLAPAEAAELWARYLVTAWRGAPRRIVVHAQRWQERPHGVLARLRSNLGRPFDEARLRRALDSAFASHGDDAFAPHGVDAFAPPADAGEHVPPLPRADLELAHTVRALIEDETRLERAAVLLDAIHGRWVAERRAGLSERRASVARRVEDEHRRRIHQLEGQVEDLEGRVASAEQRWAGTARSATAREDELALQVQHLQAEIRRQQDRIEQIARDYDRLRKRRVVKAALAAAEAARPAVRAVRALRKRRLGRGRAAATATVVVPTDRVFTVILNYRHTDDTLRLLGSLGASEVRSQFPVVVDNGSGGEALGRLRDGLGARTLIDAGANLGYAAGNNLGIRYALEHDAEFVWILNPDTTVEADTLTRLLRTMEEHPDCGIVGPRLLNGGSSPVTIASDGGIIRWDQGGASDHRHVGARDADTPAGEPLPADFVPGACMLIRRAVFEDVGLLPEEWFLYFEETDFNARVAAAGWRVLVDPQARVWHHKRSSGRLPSPYYVYYFVRNRLRFAQRAGWDIDDQWPPDLDHWVTAWREKVQRADESWAPTFEKLLGWAVEDARNDVTGPRPEVETVPAGGQDQRG